MYISKDTLVAYIHEEDVSCKYLEVNEVVESTQGINWQPPGKCKIIDSDLVYSPAQVTEHHHVQLKDHNASEQTKQEFEELKDKYPDMFLLNNEYIGCTQLVTMDIEISCFCSQPPG